jgi:hypothetical protein
MKSVLLAIVPYLKLVTSVASNFSRLWSLVCWFTIIRFQRFPSSSYAGLAHSFMDPLLQLAHRTTQFYSHKCRSNPLSLRLTSTFKTKVKIYLYIYAGVDKIMETLDNIGK